MAATLADIVQSKRAEIVEAKARASISNLLARAADQPPARPMVDRLRAATEAQSFGVIAEIKRASPSAGVISQRWLSPSFDPGSIARAYERAGAAAVSCLTDEPFFKGSPLFLAAARAATELPVLRKDFLLDPWQIAESRAIGADAVLLIAECLDPQALLELAEAALALGMDLLLECHDPANLESVLRVADHLDAPDRLAIGINNRDLSTMTTSLRRTIDLAQRVPPDLLLVSESGIRSPQDLAQLASAGVRCVLVGEHLMRHDDPGAALASLLASSVA